MLKAQSRPCHACSSQFIGAVQLSAALDRVRAGADVMPRRQLEKVLVAELGEGCRSKLDDYEYDPLAAASIGQVCATECPKYPSNQQEDLVGTPSEQGVLKLRMEDSSHLIFCMHFPCMTSICPAPALQLSQACMVHSVCKVRASTPQQRQQLVSRWQC